jgi:hypothetical protein
MLDGAGVSRDQDDDRDQGYTEINAVSAEGAAVTQIDPEKWYRAS